MDRNELLDFNLAASEVRQNLFGIAALFRGEQITVLESASDPSLTLGSGGLRFENTWRVRIPASVQPAPRIKEELRKVGTGQVFFIVGVTPAAADSAHGLYHLVEARTP